MNISVLTKQTTSMLKKSLPKTFILLILTIVIVILVLGFVIYPTIQKVASIYREVADNNSYVSKLNLKRTTLTNHISIIDEKISQVKFFDKVSEQNPNYPEIIANIEAIAEKNNIDLLSISFAENKDKPDEKYPSIRFTKVGYIFEGDFEGISAFVKDLENYPKVIVIDSLSISSNKLKKGFSANISLKIAYFQESL